MSIQLLQMKVTVTYSAAAEYESYQPVVAGVHTGLTPSAWGCAMAASSWRC